MYAIELSIIRYKNGRFVDRCRFNRRIAINGRRLGDLSVRQLDRAILSLPAQMFSNSISSYPVAIRLLVISTSFSTSLPGFIPSFRARNCPPLRDTRRKINSKNSARSIAPSPKESQFVRWRGSISNSSRLVVRHATAERPTSFEILDLEANNSEDPQSVTPWIRSDPLGRGWSAKIKRAGRELSAIFLPVAAA